MPAPQQSSVPVYKETANIPRPNVAYYLHDKRDSAGFQLAKLLNVAVDKFGPKYQENKKQLEAQDDAVNIAHAQLGVEKINRATSQGTFDLITGDFEPDAYDMKQGQLAATDFSGSLRDAYMAEEAYNITDPKEFNKWLQGKVGEQIAGAKGKSPSYYNGFVKELGTNVELLTKQYAGKTKEVIANKNSQAFQTKLKLAAEADAATTRAGEMGSWLKEFLGSESSGNWNAWYGNSGNTEDLSQLTLGDILREQDKPGNDAAGLIQIVPSTLRGMMRVYGYTPDMKFTPQVQTEMALFLMKEKGLDKWLKGEMSDDVFADRLAQTWKGLKTSSGKGTADGDKHGNMATEDHSVSVGRLAQLRYLMDKNPELKKLMLSDGLKAGATELVLGGSSNTNVAKLIEGDTATGVSNVEARDHYADMLVETVSTGPNVNLDDNAIEADMANLKLSEAQRTKVREALVQRRKRDEIKSRSDQLQTVQRVTQAVLSGDIDVIQTQDPKWYPAVLERMATPDTPETETLSDEFLQTADFKQKDLPTKAFRAFLEGTLTQDGLAEAISQHKLAQTYQSVVKTPAIRDYVKSIRKTLPGAAGTIFDQLVTASLNDLIEQSDGKRPPVSAIIETVNQMADLTAQRAEAERQSIMDKYQL